MKNTLQVVTPATDEASEGNREVMYRSNGEPPRYDVFKPLPRTTRLSGAQHTDYLFVGKTHLLFTGGHITDLNTTNTARY
ncbi:hypothetical protein [Kosakonia sp. MUSA4]|uniref:hypothetical protein n=1 Tax=Kosakonia sp. MUSA4 TaxID=2067958 RepID=UPI001ABFAF10|nr:hypothetical protein [Kosakonia sp. MUSA4]